MTSRCAERVEALYIHVPFCAQKCEYCAFYSEAANGEVVNRYVAALVRELELVAADLKPRTVFFGGGTPSLLNLRQWEQILQAMQRLNLLGAKEWTVECNPATVSLDKAKLLRSYGVNRVSMGVQSLDAQLLERLGRVHSREMVFKSFDTLRQAGFDNINIDLMFAIPGQTMNIWKSTLREAIALGSEHMSSYEVIYEEDTPLFHQLQAGEFDVDEDLAAAMYEELIDFTGANGLHQYEIANFARNVANAASATSLAPSGERVGVRGRSSVHGEGRGEGKQATAHLYEPASPRIPSLACRHNVNYWHGGSYYGLGPSAAGYVRGVRTKNWSNTQMYCEQLEQGRRAIESREELSPLARAGETAAFGLRMPSGWSYEEFRDVTGFDLSEHWSKEMEQLAKLDYARIESDRFHLTRAGLRYADWAAELFVRT